MNRLQLSIGEWLRDHEETILVFFRIWSRYFSFLYFHVFCDKLSNKLLWLSCLFVLFPGEMAFSSVLLRIKTILFGRHSILREKKSQLASNLELARTPTIYGKHGIMAHIP